MNDGTFVTFGFVDCTVTVIFTRVSAEIDQFCMGLNKVCSLWDTIKQDPLPWVDVFCNTKVVTRSFFIEEMDILYSAEGSNKRMKEENIIEVVRSEHQSHNH
jgi:hypothetical protein